MLVYKVIRDTDKNYKEVTSSHFPEKDFQWIKAKPGMYIIVPEIYKQDMKKWPDFFILVGSYPAVIPSKSRVVCDFETLKRTIQLTEIRQATRHAEILSFMKNNDILPLMLKTEG